VAAGSSRHITIDGTGSSESVARGDCRSCWYLAASFFIKYMTNVGTTVREQKYDANNAVKMSTGVLSGATGLMRSSTRENTMNVYGERERKFYIHIQASHLLTIGPIRFPSGMKISNFFSASAASSIANIPISCPFRNN
jgi:hypothetical protein